MPKDEKHHETRESPADPRDSPSSAETELLRLGPSHDVSDVALAASTTGAAPTCPIPSPPRSQAQPAADKPGRHRTPMALLPGARIDDFEVVRLLGRGAFGHVYLARQLSLDRLVALKVSDNRGSEGRTMARLEHQHIVQVFSEKVDPDFNQRLLCMQLVPGVGLEKLIDVLHATHAGSRATGQPPWTGADLLAVIDRSAALPAALDPSALHDREALGRMDAVEATAWFGVRLAEALDFAHHHGVLHRDIKPANILVDSYGRPMLADFNISSQPVGSEPSGDEMFGGTFAYMAPEHLDAFNPAEPTGPEAVTARSDLFSLGLVLQQLLEGRIGFSMPERRANMAETLHTMANLRRSQRPRIPPGPPSARKTLHRTIARCLEPRPEERFASGADLADQLDGCRRLRQAERELPRLPAALAPVLRRPFLWLILLVLLPQLVASAVNIAYNTSQIVGRLSEPQQGFFFRLVALYNVVVYPAAIAVFVLAARPVWRCWRALSGSAPLAEGEVEAARRSALQLPRWIAALTAAGWFPGGILFPLAIAIATPPLSFEIHAHFVASFCLSGLVALAYSLCGVEFVVLRGLYPGMWRNVRAFNETANRELAPVSTHLRWIQRLAVSIPLLAALLMLVLGGDAPNAAFRWLVFGLIVLGLFGSYVAGVVTRGLSQVIVALTSTKG